MKIKVVFNGIIVDSEVGKLEEDTKQFLDKMQKAGFYFTYQASKDTNKTGSVESIDLTIKNIKPKLVK